MRTVTSNETNSCIAYVHKQCCQTPPESQLLLRLPVGRGGVINSPRSVFLCFYFSFSVFKVGLPLMGDTAVRTTV